MNSAAQLFSSKDVLLDLDVANKQALFGAIGRLWEEHHGAGAGEVVDSLTARENLGSTALGEGVAIPHARIEGLDEAVAVFARPKVPIEFGAPDGKPVASLLVMLFPAQATERHWRILADVAAMLANAQFRDQLSASKSQDEVHQLFTAWRAPTGQRLV
jgi:PTS system nitrogen regulatory IIA component